MTTERQRWTDTEQNLHSEWAAGIVWTGHNRIHLKITHRWVQLNEITVHNTYGTLKQKGKGGCVHISVSARALRSDCLFLSQIFKGVWGGACNGENLMALYRQPRQIHIYLNIKCTLIQIDQGLKRFNNSCQFVKEVWVKYIFCVFFYQVWFCLQECLHSTPVSAYFLFHYYINEAETKGSNISVWLWVFQAEVGQIHIHIVTILKQRLKLY